MFVSSFSAKHSTTWRPRQTKRDYCRIPNHRATQTVYTLFVAIGSQGPRFCATLAASTAALSQMVKALPQSRWKYLNFETKRDGRKGWKVQYDGIQHLGLAKLSKAKTCLHNLLVKKGVISANDSLPLRAKFRKNRQNHQKHMVCAWTAGVANIRGCPFQ